MKTRRTKRHNPKGPLYSGNIVVRVIKTGARVRLAGGARKDRTVKENAQSKPVFLGRIYTGVNAGKVYPYAGKKRGGSGVSVAPRRTVAVVAGR